MAIIYARIEEEIFTHTVKAGTHKLKSVALSENGFPRARPEPGTDTNN